MLTVEFSGVIRTDLPCCSGPLPADLSSTFAPGDTFTGRYAYNTNLPAEAVLPNPWTTVYNGVSELSVTINGLHFSTTVAHVEVANDTNLGTVDAIFLNEGVYNSPQTIMSGPLVGNAFMHDFSLVFWDDTATALQDMSLPAGAPDLSIFDDSVATFSFFDPVSHRGHAMWGEITAVSASVIAVPEPSSLAVGLLGLLPIAGRLQKRRRMRGGMR